MICKINYIDNDNIRVGVIRVTKELNTENVYAFEDFLKDLLEKKENRIILDLTEVKYMCSRGIGVITHYLAQCRKRGGDVKLACINNFVAKLLEVIKLDEVFDTPETVEEALKLFKN